MSSLTPQLLQENKPLSRLEHIRKRPGMYLGRTDNEGLLRCIEEVLASIFQKHRRTRCSWIEVTLRRDQFISVRSNDCRLNWRASDVGSLLDRINNEFSRFVDRPSPYALGEAGVGPSCVNALSEQMIVRTTLGSRVYETYFRQGETTRPFYLARTTSTKMRDGLLVCFKPDRSIFHGATVEFHRLAWRLREIAFLTPGLDIRLNDQRKVKAKVTYRYPNGLADFLQVLPAAAARFHDETLIFKGNREGVRVDLALQFEATHNFQLFSYVNHRATNLGGTDIEGLLVGIAEAINANRLGYPANQTPDTIKHGISCVLHVQLADPKYYGATKSRVLNREIFDAVRSTVFRGLSRYFKADPELHKSIWLHLDGIKFWVERMREDLLR